LRGGCATRKEEEEETTKRKDEGWDWGRLREQEDASFERRMIEALKQRRREENERREAAHAEELKKEMHDATLQSLTLTASASEGCPGCAFEGLFSPLFSEEYWVELLSSLDANSSLSLLGHLVNHTHFPVDEPGVFHRATLDAIHARGTARQMEELIDLMEWEGIMRSPKDTALLISTYAKNGLRDEANHLMMELEMENCTVGKDVYDQVIATCEDGIEADAIVNRMYGAGLIPDAETFRSLFEVQVRSKDAEEAHRTFHTLLDRRATIDVQMCERLISVLDEKNLFKPVIDVYESMLKLATGSDEFDGMPHANETADVNGTAQESKAKPRLMPTHEMYRLVSKACVNLDEYLKAAEVLHHRTSHTGAPTGPTVLEVVINGLVEAKEYQAAQRLYDEAKAKRVKMSLNVYRAMVTAFEESNKISEAIDLWRDLKRMQMIVDEKSYQTRLDNLLLKKYGQKMYMIEAN